MAESNQVTLNKATIPGGEVAAADTIAAKQYQLIKLILGAAGANDGPVSAANPMPTGDAAAAAALASILAKLSADPATQATLTDVLNKLTADPSTAAGVTAAAAAVVAQLVTNLAGTQPVSVAALPLPADAATQATLAGLLTELEGKADLAETQPVTQATLISGEDQTNDLIKVEQRYSYSRINTATTTVVKNAPGFLQSINVLATAAGTITVYDNTAGSGTVIAVLKAGINEGTYTFNVECLTGITIITAGASDITVSFR
jgi:hypothetical protein